MGRDRLVRSGGFSWRVFDASSASIGALLEGFDRALERGREMKDVRVKRLLEVEAGGRTYLIKVYKPGGALRRLKAALLGSKAARESRALERLVAMGLPTMPLVAVGERRGESFVVMERAADRVGLDQLLARTGGRRRRALLEEYGRWARRVHDAGVAQYDFNPTNVLVRAEGDPDLRLIDFERLTFQKLSRPARLRALAKIDRMIPASQPDRLRFLKAYLGIEALDRGRIRAAVRDLLAHRATQVGRDVARLRKACTRDNRNFGRFRIGTVRGYFRKSRPGQPGIEPRSVGDMILKSDFGRRVRVPDALAAWRNLSGRSGPDAPVAVILDRGGRSGCLIFLSPPP